MFTRSGRHLCKLPYGSIYYVSPVLADQLYIDRDADIKWIGSVMYYIINKMIFVCSNHLSSV